MDAKPTNRPEFFEEVRLQLDALVRRLHVVEREIEVREDERGELLRQIRHLVRYAREAGAPVMVFGAVAVVDDESFTRLSKTRAARKILYPDKAYTTRDLYGRMREKGYHFRGRRPISNLAAALQNSKYFERKPDGRWCLRNAEEEWWKPILPPQGEGREEDDD